MEHEPMEPMPIESPESRRSGPTPTPQPEARHRHYFGEIDTDEHHPESTQESSQPNSQTVDLQPENQPDSAPEPPVSEEQPSQSTPGEEAPEVEAAEEKTEAKPETMADKIMTEFPSLKEAGEQGEQVAEALALLVEKGKIDLEDLKQLVPGGIQMTEADAELPEHQQPKAPGVKRHLYIAAQKEGAIYIYPHFFNEGDSPEKRAHILAHELGHMMDGRPVMREKDGQKVREKMVDAKEYMAKFGNRDPRWHGMYAGKFVRDFPDDAPHEVLAEDIADYLRSDTAQEWVTHRVARMKPKDQAVYQPLIAANDWENAELAPLLAHAEEVMVYLGQTVGNKAEYVTSKGKEKDLESDYDDLWSSYYSSGGGGLSSTYSSYTDMNLLEKWYDTIFGVRNLAA